MLKKIFFSAFVLLSFSACQKRVAIKKTDRNSSYELQESIARLNDIPDLPLQARVQNVMPSQQNSEDMQIICDAGLLGWDDVQNYYEQEMERFGWDLQALYRSDRESLIVFRKASGSLCIISLKDKQLVITKLKK